MLYVLVNVVVLVVVVLVNVVLVNVVLVEKVLVVALLTVDPGVLVVTCEASVVVREVDEVLRVRVEV